MKSQAINRFNEFHTTSDFITDNGMENFYIFKSVSCHHWRNVFAMSNVKPQNLYSMHNSHRINFKINAVIPYKTNLNLLQISSNAWFPGETPKKIRQTMVYIYKRDHTFTLIYSLCVNK